jgi:hypothetical protein
MTEPTPADMAFVDQVQATFSAKVDDLIARTAYIVAHSEMALAAVTESVLRDPAYAEDQVTGIATTLAVALIRLATQEGKPT